MERTINKVFDVENGQIYYSNDFFTKSEHELIHWRRALEEAVILGKPRLICPYCKQMLKLCGRKDSRGKVSYFSHLYDSDDCEIKTTTQLSKEEIEAHKYGLQSESERHQRLKTKIANALMGEKSTQIGIHSVEIEKRINSHLPYMNWRKPDVQAIYKGKNIVFELQLSTTFLSVVVDRDIFYRLNGYYIIWVFNFDDNQEYINLYNMMCKDIYYANKRNVFIFDKRAQELSSERDELILCCRWLDANGKFTKEEYLSLEQLSFDTETFKPYYVDADKLYYDANPQIKSNIEHLEKSRKEIIQGLLERQKLELELLQAECICLEETRKEIKANSDIADVYKIDDKMGFIYKEQILSKPIYSNIEWNDKYKMFDIVKARRHGLANCAGEIIIPCVTSIIERLEEGLYLIQEKKQWRIWGSTAIIKKVSTTDKYLFDKLEYDFSLITFIYQERYTSYNKEKQFVIFPSHQTLEIDSIDKTNLKIALNCDEYSIHPNGFIYRNIANDVDLVVMGEHLFGLNKAGEFVLSPKYNELNYVSDDCVFVKIEGCMGVLTVSGQTIVPVEFEEVERTNHGFYKTKKSTQNGYNDWTRYTFGLFDKEGTEIFASEYNDIVPISQNLFIVKKHNKYGLLDRYGRELIPYIYDYLVSGDEGELIASYIDNCHHERRCIINYNGNIVFGKDLKCKTIIFQNGIYAFCNLSEKDIESGFGANWSLLKKGNILAIPIKANKIQFIFDNFLIVSSSGGSSYCVSYENVPLTPPIYHVKILSTDNFVAECECYQSNQKYFIDNFGKLYGNAMCPTISSDCVKDNQMIKENVFIGTNTIPSKQIMAFGVYSKMQNNDNAIKIIVPFDYDEIEYTKGYILCKKKVKQEVNYALYDINGVEIIPLFWNVSSIEFRADGIIKLTIDSGKNCCRNRHNVWLNQDFTLFLPWYNEITQIDIFKNGIANAKQNGKFGKIDMYGKPIKEIIESFEKGIVKIYSFENYGLDTIDGRELIPCKYTLLERMPNGMFLGDHHDIISSDGALISSVNGLLSFFNKNLFILERNYDYQLDNKFCLCDMSGNVISDNYSTIREESGYIYVEQVRELGRGWNTYELILCGLYNLQGRNILSVNYNYISFKFRDIVICRHKNICNIVNLNTDKGFNATQIDKIAEIEGETYYSLHSSNEKILVDHSFTQLGVYSKIDYCSEDKRIIGVDRNGRLLNVLTGEIIRDARQIELGSVYEGIVTGIKPYGVFVKIYDVHNGMIHKSILNKYEMKSHSFNIGQSIKVKVIHIKDNMKLDLEIVNNTIK